MRFKGLAEQIVNLMCEGFTYKQIQDRLNSSPSPNRQREVVKNLRRALFCRLPIRKDKYIAKKEEIMNNIEKHNNYLKEVEELRLKYIESLHTFDD